MEDKKIEFFCATPADYKLITELRLEFSAELLGPQSVEKEALVRDSLENYFKAEIGKNYISWYATVNDVPAAAGGLVIRVQPGNFKNPSGIWGYIMSVYTRPQFRRMGLSSGIMKRLVESGRERNTTAFELHATKMGEPVYINEGFEKFHEPTYRKFF